MIKGVAGIADHPVILLGISGENFTRLLAKEPILVKLKDLHSQLPDVKIILIAGNTEQDLRNLLEESIPGFDYPVGD